MLDNLNTKQKKILGIIAIVFIIILGMYFYNRNNNKNIVDLDENILVSNNNTKENSINEEAEEIIVIHITGAVKTPGVVRLKEGSRMEDAVEAARRANRRCGYLEC